MIDHPFRIIRSARFFGDLVASIEAAEASAPDSEGVADGVFEGGDVELKTIRLAHRRNSRALYGFPYTTGSLQHRFPENARLSGPVGSGAVRSHWYGINVRSRLDPTVSSRSS